MPRTILRSHLVGGSVAFAVLLIGSGAAWAQDGAAGSTSGAAATASGESVDTGSTSASSPTGSFDSALATNPLGLSPQSTGPQRSNNRRQSEYAEDAVVDGFLRNDSGLRSAPSFGANASSNTTSDFSPRGRSLGLTTGSTDSVASTVASGKAFGVNAIPSDFQGGSSGVGSGSDNGRALGINASASFFSAHVRSKGTTEVDDHGKGKGKAHGRNADDILTGAADQGKGKKHGHGNGTLDDSPIVQIPTGNPVISDAVAPAGSVVPVVLPAVSVIPSLAGSSGVDLSSPGLQGAPSPVPEPANWLLLALGLLVLAGRALMRRGTLVR